MATQIQCSHLARQRFFSTMGSTCVLSDKDVLARYAPPLPAGGVNVLLDSMLGNIRWIIFCSCWQPWDQVNIYQYWARKKKLFQVKLNDITSCYLSEAILVKASLVKQGTTPQTCSNPKRFTWIPCLLPWKLGKASVASLKHIFWPTCASYCCSDVWWSFARFECLKNIRVVQLEEKH